ncbi:MAG: 1-deoxy-D-xylulose-5-phosphate reductoisomerase [Acidimicrobiales bacterium]|nr:1-deoxy-D-xylulose-5-phosphate reductoisomerase [Acidimicrobiales bacterium]MYD84417.1 1-deoxy-D-xylulose-5-phosphate reductoisomerase [Acidimicrobiales bacterium]MYJ64917.1 1-deoxy-D-xylulose-5-phosphate reductoisomerase [Acidimicrobiales bacterium]
MGATTVAVLGSTGSIGTQTLEVMRTEPDRFRAVALAAHSSVSELAAQATEFAPAAVAIGDAGLESELRAALPAGVEVLAGADAFADLAGMADVVVNGVVGFAGLGVTLAALRAGRRLALANKESLIAAGPLVQPLRAVAGAELIPVDSEHSALHQCLAGQSAPPERLILTGSGGPFRGRVAAELREVTLADALAHPTWSMGPKITVDSSTLMNKGLEVIEAHELFGIDYDGIEVVIQPQSVVHSMVTFADGSTIAQLSLPDMRLPIGYALAYPERIGTPFGAVDWSAIGRLDFELPDTETFGCLRLAYDAGRAGGTAPAWLNGANEHAVSAFLAGQLRWHEIERVISNAMQHHDGAAADSVDAVIAADRGGRRSAAAAVMGIRA